MRGMALFKFTQPTPPFSSRRHDVLFFGFSHSFVVITSKRNPRRKSTANFLKCWAGWWGSTSASSSKQFPTWTDNNRGVSTFDCTCGRLEDAARIENDDVDSGFPVVGLNTMNRKKKAQGFDDRSSSQRIPKLLSNRFVPNAIVATCSWCSLILLILASMLVPLSKFMEIHLICNKIWSWILSITFYWRDRRASSSRPFESSQTGDSGIIIVPHRKRIGKQPRNKARTYQSTKTTNAVKDPSRPLVLGDAHSLTLIIIKL